MQTTDIGPAAIAVANLIKLRWSKGPVDDESFYICWAWALKNLASIILYWIAFILLLPIVILASVIIIISDSIEGAISNLQQSSYDEMNDKLRALNKARGGI